MCDRAPVVQVVAAMDTSAHHTAAGTKRTIEIPSPRFSMAAAQVRAHRVAMRGGEGMKETGQASFLDPGTLSFFSFFFLDWPPDAE